jgi:hypothetical protein
VAKPKFSEDSVTQEIDLGKLLGLDLSDASELKQYIGQLIIDKIKTRTEDGIGFNGKPLKSPYSKTYSDSMEFKAFGKSKSKVNMTLSGDMLGLMDIVEDKGDKITIGWDDPEQNAKAYNHNTGDTVPKRPFFGINNKELYEIIREVRPDIKRAIAIKEDEGLSKYEKFSLSLLDKLNADTED